MSPPTASVRVDAWLNAARIFRSRNEARDACEGGHVEVNGARAKPARAVEIGDEIRARAPRGRFEAVVLAVAERRLSPPLARALYEDRSPPPPPRDEAAPSRARGRGRPTKADRRAISRAGLARAED
ncbi:MAG: RNA-binding S4 domain-containing protein [Polyangiaceae bacterium]|nr:RNA-binding S4 domain-containing protein [Polyangiaceae bacterium]